MCQWRRHTGFRPDALFVKKVGSKGEVEAHVESSEKDSSENNDEKTEDL